MNSVHSSDQAAFVVMDYVCAVEGAWFDAFMGTSYCMLLARVHDGIDMRGQERSGAAMVFSSVVYVYAISPHGHMADGEVTWRRL